MSAKHKRSNSISGQFAWKTIAMLESVAHRNLSLGAHRVIERIEVEHGHHGGRDNGEPTRKPLLKRWLRNKRN
jgi:hypothetical protein